MKMHPHTDPTTVDFVHGLLALCVRGLCPWPEDFGFCLEILDSFSSFGKLETIIIHICIEPGITLSFSDIIS